MTNLEFIRTTNEEALVKLLCNMVKHCEDCVAVDYCYFGHTGFIDWLKAEREVIKIN